MKRHELITLLAGLAAWPQVAQPEQSTLPVIGFMSSRSPEDRRDRPFLRHCAKLLQTYLERL